MSTAVGFIEIFLVTISNSLPPINLAEGTGLPNASTLIRMSLLGLKVFFSPPTDIIITQVPVVTSEKGLSCSIKCRKSDALLSCIPQ